MRSTIRDVASLAGVSPSTVSHVINQTRFVTPETALTVQRAIRSLGYKANPAARNLRSGQSFLIGFVVSNLANYFYTRIARGIDNVLKPHGYGLMLMDAAETKHSEIEAVEACNYRSVDGLVIAPTTDDFTYLHRALTSKIPVVFVDRSPRGYVADSVLLFNEDAAHRATAHLIEKGYTDIAFVAYHFGSTCIDTTMQERINGYESAHKHAGLPVNQNYVEVVKGVPNMLDELRYGQSYRIMQELLKTQVRAVVCGNSIAAIGVCQCLKDHSVRVPEQIALISFDENVWMHMSTPSITGVSQPAESIGQIAGQRLLERIQGDKSPAECIRLQADLILRDSS